MSLCVCVCICVGLCFCVCVSARMYVRVLVCVLDALEKKINASYLMSDEFLHPEYRNTGQLT